MSVMEEIERRGVVEVLHFTTNRGIVGALASKALLSRCGLRKDQYLEHVLHLNSAIRPEDSALFDKSENWIDYVNLSVSEINRRFFDVSSRWHMDADVWWGILAFSSEIMAHEGVYFATTNNSYEHCLRNAGVEGLELLFGASIPRKNSWRAQRLSRPLNLPTCEQAEVLYPSKVSISYLRRIYVKEEEHCDLARGWLLEFGLPSVEVVISTEKFLGRPN
ncbi:DarT ssDNA thymidine ADP-ribosyltransferase family protein [Salinicola sp. DM10]|uniref:DarT ssDNA thymidine ADP-ribosyltransferase family protein n=1 Tax=Salinicola sp. DM10 TaxID=2815721 RepID=UPI001A8D5572|nr:DarT ssDNA thymidine ADP-ribosyltransferase family protein [Salinicola sp. DM10]MCE3026713.1 DUF4433 domain-containing protein [Salinicola sp. DM10]